jgi:hypothetical protein
MQRYLPRSPRPTATDARCHTTDALPLPQVRPPISPTPSAPNQTRPSIHRPPGTLHLPRAPSPFRPVLFSRRRRGGDGTPDPQRPVASGRRRAGRPPLYGAVAQLTSNGDPRFARLKRHGRHQIRRASSATAPDHSVWFAPPCSTFRLTAPQEGCSVGPSSRRVG